MRKERGVMGKLGLLLFILALIAGCSSKPVCKEGKVGPGMVFIPAGEFIMGSELDWKEEPQHIEYTPAYWIDKYEVTVSEYRNGNAKENSVMKEV